MGLPTAVRTQMMAVLQSLPGIDTTSGRRALIAEAGIGDTAYANITFEGSSAEFCSLLVDTLDRYGSLPDGRNPLVAILNAAKMRVGQEKQAECDDLIRAIEAYCSIPPPSSHPNRRRHWIIATGCLALTALLIAAVWIFWPGSTPTYPLAGVIFDAVPPHAPVSGVTVSLPEFELSMTTTENGQFAFDVPAERVTDVHLIAEKAGYQTFREYPTLGNIDFNFQLKRE